MCISKKDVHICRRSLLVEAVSYHKKGSNKARTPFLKYDLFGKYYPGDNFAEYSSGKYINDEENNIIESDICKSPFRCLHQSDICKTPFEDPCKSDICKSPFKPKYIVDI